MINSLRWLKIKIFATALSVFLIPVVVGMYFFGAVGLLFGYIIGVCFTFAVLDLSGKKLLDLETDGIEN